MFAHPFWFSFILVIFVFLLATDFNILGFSNKYLSIVFGVFLCLLSVASLFRSRLDCNIESYLDHVTS